MQIMRVFIWTIGFSLLLGTSLSAQDLVASTLLFKIELKGADQFSIDRRGQLYLSDTKGNIWQYSSDGEFVVNYSPTRQGPVYTLEAWPTQNPFAFYQDYQDFLLFDRFLVPLKDQPTRIGDVGFVRVATISADNHIWMVDDVDLSLKKINPATGRSVIISPLNLLTDAEQFTFSFIREYQNKVFLVEPSVGILIFDNMGNYERTLSLEGVSWLGLSGNGIQYLQKNRLVIRDMYSEEEQGISLPESADKALYHNGVLYLIHRNGLSAYERR